MNTITRRLARLEDLELRRREQMPKAETGGYSRRLMEERLEAMSRRLQGVRDPDEFVEPNHTFEEVREMIHAHLEESRIRREENAKRAAERPWSHRHPSSRF